jgi:CRISPR/Cas system-associated exonuclease Cas4 (RecB family)
MIEILTSPRNAERLAAGAAFVLGFAPGTEVLILGPSHEAASDFVRGIGARRGATFGLHSSTLLHLASRLAVTQLAARGLSHGTRLGAEATAARAVFEAVEENRLEYFGPVARSPNFARALASTLEELRLERVPASALAARGASGRDLAELLRRFEEHARAAGIADRAELLAAAADAVRTASHSSGHSASEPDPARSLGAATAVAGMPILLLDVPIHTRAERDLIAALAAAAPRFFATIPEGDDRTRRAFESSMGAHPVQANQGVPDEPNTPLTRLQRRLFSSEELSLGREGDEVAFFSAPGEGRECVEIARRMQEEARRGVPFDEMAVFVRSPEIYSALLESALRRAGIPAYFSFGTRRPDPAGRAFLALLHCKAEGFSAKRFAEYLSLAQVPQLTEDGAPPEHLDAWAAPRDDALGLASDPLENADWPVDPTLLGDEPEESPDSSPVVHGTLRAPWKWEQLLVEAAVIGGRDRWTRRLDGLEELYRLEHTQLLSAGDVASPRLAGVLRDLQNLKHLRSFVLPVIDTLAAFPEAATWGEWIKVLQRFAGMVLRRPEPALTVLSELSPMARIGPVRLEEVCDVLSERLATTAQDPPRRRHGRVFVATADQARARSFVVVFVPGLAERLFPQKPHEDPMLLDADRAELAKAAQCEPGGEDVDLQSQSDRALRERLLLRLCAGAAQDRIHFSYPRVEVAQSRPRVPSFYGLDVLRAITGRLPDSEELERSAAVASSARLGWPAPTLAESAIDDAEHDLAVLGPLLRAVTSGQSEGRARYLLELNPHLARSLRTRWKRWEDRVWSPYDGLIRPGARVLGALAFERLRARPYSVSALQKFAICPYRFLLSAILRLSPRLEPERVEQMDARTRGELVHSVQAEVLRNLTRGGEASLAAVLLEEAITTVDAVLNRTADTYRELLAPPILRVWQDEIERIRIDLHAWVNLVVQGDHTWRPIAFELGFGMGSPGEAQPPSIEGAETTNGGQDLPPASSDVTSPRPIGDPVILPGGYQLRGAVDLVEQSADGIDHETGMPSQPGGAPRPPMLRVTDYKTGANNTKPGMIVGRGEMLQPVLYSMAVEAVTGQPVAESRLFFCTTRVGFVERKVVMDESARHYGLRVLEIVDQALEHGFLPPMPRKNACIRCDYRNVCGPHEELRSSMKKRSGREDELIANLAELRDMP